MTFVYDIYVNFQTICYDFYEWNKKDEIMRIKKIPIFQIEESLFQKLMIHETQLDPNTFELLKNKTELFKSKKKISACLFTNNQDIIAVLLDNNGKIIKKSSLLLEEESTILKSIRKVDFLTIELKELKKRKIPLITRQELERQSFLLKKLEYMEEEELTYLYFECFNHKENDQTLMKKSLKSEIMKGNEEISTISYNFLKLIYNK